MVEIIIGSLRTSDILNDMLTECDLKTAIELFADNLCSITKVQIKYEN